MDKKEVEDKLLSALRFFLKFDHYLLENDLSERSISHKFAERLSYEFPEYNVDCEFNKVFKDPKKIEAFEEFVKEIISTDELTQEETNQVEYFQKETGEVFYDFINREIVRDKRITIRRIFPDIIIHHRGSSENLLVVEIKKSTNRPISQRKWDETKLKYMTTKFPFNYKYGAMITIPSGLDLQGFKQFHSTQMSGYNIFEIK